MKPFCNLCGQPTYGQGVSYRRQSQRKGLVICLSCEDETKRCDICHIPVHPAMSEDGSCPTCAEGLPVCAACERRIKDRAYQNLANNVCYCESCFTRQPRCGICSGAVGLKGQKLHDGRFICAQCNKTAIYEFEKANVLYRRVIALTRYHLGIELKICPALVLVDRQQMFYLIKQTSLHQPENPDMIFGVFVRRNEKRGIYIETGLPQILMLQVMAHEYAHAWQTENSPRHQDPLIREGFAEWVAYRVLTTIGSVKKAALMEQRQDLYGQGLQLMLNLERKGGSSAVFELAQR